MAIAPKFLEMLVLYILAANMLTCMGYSACSRNEEWEVIRFDSRKGKIGPIPLIETFSFKVLLYFERLMA